MQFVTKDLCREGQLVRRLQTVSWPVIGPHLSEDEKAVQEKGQADDEGGSSLHPGGVCGADLIGAANGDVTQAAAHIHHGVNQHHWPDRVVSQEAGGKGDAKGKAD